LWDYKVTDSVRHKELTVVSPELIRENFEILYKNGASLLIRAPLIPGVNDSEEHLQAILRLANEYPKLIGVELLPYHDSGLGKFDRLHLPRPKLNTRPPGEDTKQRWRDFFRQNGRQSVTGKMAPITLN
jgi:pyruvate formate lyase activating enzyme